MPLTPPVPSPNPRPDVDPDWSESQTGGPVLIGKLVERARLTPAERAGLENLAFEYGNAPESYFITEPKGQCLFTPQMTAGLAVVKQGRYWHAPGGLLADEPDKPALVAQLAEIARRERVMVAVYSVNATDAPLFVQAGFDVNKFGEEPVLDLSNLDWSGKSFEWVRRQTNFCKRNGLTFREVHLDREPPEMKLELRSILDHDLKHRPYTRELTLMEGRFVPENLQRRRLFIVEQSDRHRIEAFLCCHPMSRGLGWSFETYRRRPDAIRGTIPFLMRTAVDQLQSEGARFISLCMIPGKGVEQQAVGNPNPFIRRMLGFWYRNTNILFNLQGQTHFKSRFRPQFHERYVVSWPKMNLRSMTSFLYAVGAFGINPLNALKNGWRHLRKTSDHE